MRLSKVLDILAGLSPHALAEPWDKVGLQAGSPAQNVRRAMLCIDLTPAVLREAVALRANLIVAYHPLIFRALDHLRDDGAAWQHQVALEAVRRRIAIYSPHTALDAARGGLNEWLAGGLGKGRVYSLGPNKEQPESRFKLVTFVPAYAEAAVRSALAKANAGIIGRYVECSFITPGQGTFRGLEGTRPVIGQAGRLERVDELRLEMVCDAVHLPQAVAALRAAHPYEEPAFDLLRLETPPPTAETTVGVGRAIELDEPVSLDALVERVKKHLGLPKVEVAAPASMTQSRHRTGRIGSVAVCAGSGAEVVRSYRVDACLTGEMKHHDILAAVQTGRVVILAGHTQTERPYLAVYRKRILAAGGGAVEWLISKADQPPGRWV